MTSEKNCCKALREDLAGIVSIYNQAILEGGLTADIDTFTVEDKIDWFYSHDPGVHPVFVQYAGTELAGWLSVSPYRPGRRALRYTVEVSCYIRADFRQRQIGSLLLCHAVEWCKQKGYRKMFAIVLDTNTSSLNFFRKHGFVEWGHLPGVAEFERTGIVGQYYMGLSLYSASANLAG